VRMYPIANLASRNTYLYSAIIRLRDAGVGQIRLSLFGTVLGHPNVHDVLCMHNC
jgi:hypothetical protein